MKHNDTVQTEFTRQAESYRASPVLRETEMTSRVGAALGKGLQRVLDLACGPGVLLSTLAGCAKSVVGMDLTEKNLVLAGRADTGGIASLVRAAVEALPFASGSFDAAVVRLAMHHFLDPAAVLVGLRSALRPGGRLVILDLLAPEDRETAALRDAIERLRDPSHTALLSQASMTSVLAQTGYILRHEARWTKPREFAEWAAIMNEPRRMADVELVLRALSRSGRDPTGLDLREEGSKLCFTYEFGLFVADTA